MKVVPMAPQSPNDSAPAPSPPKPGPTSESADHSLPSPPTDELFRNDEEPPKPKDGWKPASPGNTGGYLLGIPVSSDFTTRPLDARLLCNCGAWENATFTYPSVILGPGFGSTPEENRISSKIGLGSLVSSNWRKALYTTDGQSGGVASK